MLYLKLAVLGINCSYKVILSTLEEVGFASKTFTAHLHYVLVVAIGFIETNEAIVSFVNSQKVALVRSAVYYWLRG